jgi:fumarate reductase subunit D
MDMQTTHAQQGNEFLSLPQRVVEPIITIVVMMLVIAFFVFHQATNTGFFTAKFGPFEMLCFYGPMIVSLAAPIVRGIRGKRNPGRPFEALTNLCTALAAIWLLIVFPFNFAHLADALPGGMQFFLAWITNGIGRIVLIIQIALGMFAAIVTTAQYLSMRWREVTGSSL